LPAALGVILNRNQGFTLIELIVVIVILGILAVTAAPKFIDLSTDAKIATLKAAEGSMRSGAQMIYSKAIIKNKVVGAHSMIIDSGTVSLHGGYPAGNWSMGVKYIIDVGTLTPLWNNASVCETQWCYRANQTNPLPSGISTSSGRIAKLITKGYSWNDECGTYYINHEDDSEPEIGIEMSDC